MALRAVRRIAFFPPVSHTKSVGRFEETSLPVMRSPHDPIGRRALPHHWQRDFFDHRLRDDESFEEKAAYILNNPVRAGLVNRFEDWPYKIQLR
jgi:hypothetical protein